MAVIAGKVAPRFMGAYNSSTTYQFYDAVTHNNKLYFCKASGTVGKTPSGATDDNWFLSLDGTFTDAASLGGETAAQWQTKLDNIQTTSRATLSTAGWYRVSEYTGSAITARGAGANGVDLFIKRNYGNADNEFHALRLLSTQLNQEIVSLSDKSNVQLITKVRYTRETSGTKAFLEIYYNGSGNNIIVVDISHVMDAWESTWQAITPTLTSENVDGVTITATYNIPANASPVTDLDLAEVVLPYRKSDTVDGINTIYDTIASDLSGNTSYKCDVQHLTMHPVFGGGKFVVHGYKADANYEWQIVIGYWGAKFYRNKGAGVWGDWKKDATTTDLTTALAGYLPKTGGGTISANNDGPLAINNTNGAVLALLRFKASGTQLGMLGFNGSDNPVYRNNDGTAEYKLLHAGNSAKVVTGTSAPSDTTSVWIDTTNKKTKAYIDGAWTVIA